MLWFGVAVAGAAGASLRYVVDHAVNASTAGSSVWRTFPWGIALVNITGAALIGVVAGLVARGMSPDLGIVLGGGFCGAYTTVSTLMYDTVLLAERGDWRSAALNLSTLALGWAAAATGWLLVT